MSDNPEVKQGSSEKEQKADNSQSPPREVCASLVPNKMFYLDAVGASPDQQQGAKGTCPGLVPTKHTGQQSTAWKILVVEDDRDTHKLYKSVLGPKGYNIMSAYNGEEGLKQIQRVLPDLLISDMSMPVMDGRSLVLSIKKIAPNLPVLIISGKKGMQNDPELRLASQVHSFLVKPVNPKKLIDTVEQIFACKKALLAQKEAREKQAEVPESTFNGCIQHIGLFPILQMLGAEGKSGYLELHAQQQSAHIYFTDGKIVHCACARSVGKEAFFHIIRWMEGKFEFKPMVKPPGITMNDNVEYLLLEGARRLDEEVCGQKLTDHKN